MVELFLVPQRKVKNRRFYTFISLGILCLVFSIGGFFVWNNFLSKSRFPSKHITFEKNNKNVLNVRQRYASVDSVELEWDKVKGALAYNVYVFNPSGRKTHFTTKKCTFGRKVDGRLGFYDQFNETVNGMYNVVPIIDTIEEQIDYFIKPIIFSSSELITKTFIDSFDRDEISNEYQFTSWHYRYKYPNKTFDDGGQVSITDSGLSLYILSTNNGPALNFVCERNRAKTIELSFDAFVYRDNDYHYFRIVTPYTITGMYHHRESKRRGIWTWDRNDDYNTGFKRIGSTEIYDEWMKVLYRMNYSENTIDVSFGPDNYTIPFDFETVQSNNLLFTITNFGWGTGHELIIDNLAVKYN